MDIHIPYLFIYLGLFLTSFYFIAIGMNSYQNGHNQWWSPWVIFTGILGYLAACVSVIDLVVFLTATQAKFVFIIAAVVLLLSYFFNWHKWVLLGYSITVTLVALGLYFNLFPG